MREVEDKIEGPFVIEEDMLCRGMITVEATVRRGCTLDLRGMVTGNLVIEPGAQALIHGTVAGTVINRGGHVEIFGTVGAVADAPGARTTIAPTAALKVRS